MTANLWEPLPLAVLALLAVLGAASGMLYWRDRLMRREQDWWELPQFCDYSLEESFVLDVVESETGIEFIIDAALADHHPHYLDRGRQKIVVRFPNATRISWIKKAVDPFRDQDGNFEDYGEIHVFVYDSSKYRLAGDWGEVEIVSEKMRVEESE